MSRARTLAVLPGDGIGPEVIAAATQVLEATGLALELAPAEVGLAAFRSTRHSVPPDVLALCRDADAVLFGATTTPPNVAGYRSAIVTLRQELGLHVNLRPARSLPGLGAPGLDLLVVRENTEGLYAGIEDREGPDRATALRVITRAASARTARAAFRHAAERGLGAVTAVHKANILRETDGLFLEACRQVAAEFPGVRLEDALVDSAAARMVLQPSAFRVLVTTNLFGDILSDVAAALQGGLGLAASANVGDHLLAEPVHGSAPDIAGKGIANPAGAIRSAALLLRHLDEPKWAERIEAAVDAALASPAARTPDLGGRASTSTMTRAILEALDP